MPKSIVLIVLATLLGEIALIVLTTLVQEVMFGGLSYSASSNFDIGFGGFATFIAAVLAGILAAMVVKGQSHWPHIIISFLITAETIFLISSDKTGDPLWADALAGLSLILGIWLGYYMIKKYNSSAS